MRSFWTGGEVETVMTSETSDSFKKKKANYPSVQEGISLHIVCFSPTYECRVFSHFTSPRWNIYAVPVLLLSERLHGEQNAPKRTRAAHVCRITPD